MLAMMQIAMGQNREALENLQRAVQLRDPGRKNPIGFPPSTDTGVDTLCSMIWVLSSLGLHDQAGRVGELVRTEITDHKLPGTIALYMPTCLGVARTACTAISEATAERYATEHVAFCAGKKSGAISPVGLSQLPG